MIRWGRAVVGDITYTTCTTRKQVSARRTQDSLWFALHSSDTAIAPLRAGVRVARFARTRSSAFYRLGMFLPFSGSRFPWTGPWTGDVALALEYACV